MKFCNGFQLQERFINFAEIFPQKIGSWQDIVNTPGGAMVQGYRLLNFGGILCVQSTMNANLSEAIYYQFINYIDSPCE